MIECFFLNSEGVIFVYFLNALLKAAFVLKPEEKAISRIVISEYSGSESFFLASSTLNSLTREEKFLLSLSFIRYDRR